jgi:PEP-CTERM motif
MPIHAAGTKFGWLLVVTAAECVTIAAARADLVVTPNAQDTPTARSIVANAASVPNKSMNAPIENKTGGGFNDSQTGNAVNGTGGAAVEVKASQDSSIPNLTGPTMSGIGTVNVTWNPGGGQGATADSLFDVFFTVDANATYSLSGRLTGNAADLNAILTLSASLLNTTDSTSLANHTTAGAFSDVVTLVTGKTYELKLDANVDGNLPGVMSTKNEDASWQFNLSTVPEPNSLVLFGLGALCVGGWYVARHRLGAQTS